MIIATILVIILILAGVFLLWHGVVSKSENPPLPTEEIRVGNAVFSVELATTTLEQMRGLSFRSGLAEGKGMLFIFSSGGIQNFWMKDMNFPIDMIWISGNTVAGFAQNADPQPGVPLWRLTIYTSPNGVDKVLEVPAGTVAKDGIMLGDPVVIGAN